MFWLIHLKNVQKLTFWRFYLTLGFSAGGGRHFLDFNLHFWGFGVPGLVGGPNDCKVEFDPDDKNLHPI